MTKLKRLATAAALATIIAAPVMAYDGYRVHDPYARAYRGYHNEPAQDALNNGRTDIYPRHHSGEGGLYGDGNYPGTVDDNLGPPYWSHR